MTGLDREELLASVEKPSSDPEKPEPVEEAIWKAMTDVAAISQETVSKSSVFIRMEAVRDQEH